MSDQQINLLEVSDELEAAMNALWRLTPPGPDNILAHPAFEKLRNACGEFHPNIKGLGFGFALATAIRSLGLPCSLPKNFEGPQWTAEEAADALHVGLRSTHCKRLHLVPMDMADELPPLAFDEVRLQRFSAAELSELFDEVGLRQAFPQQTFDAKRFAQFQWLVIEERIELKTDAGVRAFPWLLSDLRRDFGRIEPHKRNFPEPVESALFFLLLAPWETWSMEPEVDWRGFRVPWVYTFDADIFVRRILPPSADSLNWQLKIFDDDYGGTYEVEEPLVLHLEQAATNGLPDWNQINWETVHRARKSVLFETPIVHFLVRGFLADGIDEFLAHITTIEAALGLRADYDANFRVSPDRYKKMKAGKRMRARVAGLLGGRSFADQYEQLFNIRSAFLHGRAMNHISTQERVMARSLARQVVMGIVLATGAGPITSREDFLDGLIDVGVKLL